MVSLRQYGYHVCSEQDPLSHLKDWNICLLFFHRKALQPRVNTWQQHRSCQSDSLVRGKKTRMKLFLLKLNKYFCWMKLVLLKLNQYFSWMKLFLLKLNQYFCWIKLFLLKLNQYFCWMKIISCWILQHLANYSKRFLLFRFEPYCCRSRNFQNLDAKVTY